MKVTTIKESKDFNKIRMDELTGSLLTYEMKQKPKKEDVKAKRDISFKVVDEKKKEKNSSIDEDEPYS